MRFKTSTILLFLCLFLSCNNESVQITKIQIIPAPKSVKTSTDSFHLNSETGLQFSEDFTVSAKFLKEYIESGSAIRLKSSLEDNMIRFVPNDSPEHPEAYQLEVLENEIVIRASSDQGAFYAVQSLRQLLPSEFENGTFKGEDLRIKGVSIKDHPQFKYRGMHLDVGRHMYSIDFIKKYINALAMLKMNTFHWHLTEDQGWRIEIKKYPKLQEIAAYRDETLIGHYSDQPHQFDGKTYGGFYTQDEVKDIVAYASERFVTIIPEIEMPGHSQAAIAAYSELGCTGNDVEVATKWGVFEDIYCTKDETFQFLEDVLDEVLMLFPSEYIHIGGDEAPKTRWKNCENCQARIKSEGLENEHELQNYFITRIEKYLNSKGRQIIGWDEILEGGLAPNATVMSWRGTKGAVEAAKAGHNVVMTPTTHCYFDYYQSDNENEPTAIGGFLPLEKVYSFNPIPEELTIEEAKYVLGAQGNVWTEYMPTYEQVEYMAFPRILAMSEVVWASSENKNYNDFVKRLEHFNKRLDILDINYANHLYEVSGELRLKNNKVTYHLSTALKDKLIRYTLDGSEPSALSKQFEKAIPITKNTTIKSAVFESEKQLGRRFFQTINYHKALGKNITIDKEPYKYHSESGAKVLINGVFGSNTSKPLYDPEWVGFWGDDIEITIDLNEATEINSIHTRFNNSNNWIFAPNEVDVEFMLLDGTKVSDKIALQNQKNDTIVNLNYKLPKAENIKLKVKTISLKIPNYGTIPKGKQGAGNKAWTFIDEIIVN